MKVVASWSGGKDSCFAYYKAVRDGFKVSHLLNFIYKDGSRCMSHAISPKLITAQSAAIDIPIIQKKTTWDTYEQDFKKAILELKRDGIEGGVFGDIDIQEHRDWVERVCSELELKPILPLWGQKRTQILEDFINAGFEAIVVNTKAELLNKVWLGRKINKDFVKDLHKLRNVDLSGEFGEYHTFVTNGPIFKKLIEILDCKKVLRDKHWVLEISKYELRGK